MSVYSNVLNENLISELSERKIVNDTYRRLDPKKKSKIYRTAVRLFAEYGYDGLAVDQLCAQSSISKGSFFQYFPSKSHLFEFVILVFDDYLARWIEDIRQNETDVLARKRILYLYQALVVNSRLFPDEERFYLYVTSSLSHATVAIEGIDLSRHFHQYISDIIHRGVETGEIRGDVEVDLTGYLVSLIIEGILRRAYSEKDLLKHQTEEYLISFLFDGIKA